MTQTPIPTLHVCTTCRAGQVLADSDERPGQRMLDTVAALLDPGIPGRADPADLRHFLAPQAGRAPPAGAAGGKADVAGAQLFAALAQKCAEQAALVIV